MNRHDYFYRQKVSESELDSGFADAENAERNTRIDDGIVGVIAGLVPTLGSAPTVDITKGRAITSDGKRIPEYTDAASTKNFSYATATDGSATSVTGGQERWISIFAAPGRQALDLRTDGNGDSVYFNQPECLHDGTVGVLSTNGLGGSGVDKFLIVKGASAGTGTATKPALVSGAVLLCDIKRTPSDASNVLDTSRRQIYSIPDTAAVGTGNGLGVLMSAMTTWLGGRTNPAQASLHAAIDKIITDLAATTASDDGAERIGAAAGAGALGSGSVRSQVDTLDTRTHMTGAVSWLGGRSFAASDLIQTIVATLIGDLGATTASDDGAERVGAQASGNLSSGSVRSQLDHLDTAKGELAQANAWSAKNTFTQAVATDVPVEFGGTVADDDYRLLWQTSASSPGTTGGQRAIRVYAIKTSETTRKMSLVITYNAAWVPGSPGHWAADLGNATTSPAIKLSLGKDGSTNSGILGFGVFFRLDTSTIWLDGTGTSNWDNYIGVDNAIAAANRSPDVVFGNQPSGFARVYVENDVPKIKLSTGTVKTFTIT